MVVLSVSLNAATEHASTAAAAAAPAATQTQSQPGERVRYGSNGAAAFLASQAAASRSYPSSVFIL